MVWNEKIGGTSEYACVIASHFKVPPVNGTGVQRNASSAEKTLKILQKMHGTGGGC
jgi:hypothetical protein